MRKIADPGSGYGKGPRNIKSMQPNFVANFFMTYFYKAGDHGPRPCAPPPKTATGENKGSSYEKESWAGDGKIWGVDLDMHQKLLNIHLTFHCII